MKLSISLFKNKIAIFSLLLVTLLFGSFFVKSAFADAFTLSGKVLDSSGNNIAEAAIVVTDSNTNTQVGATTTDGSGNYSLIVAGGTYNVQVTPSEETNFAPAIALSQNITSDKILNFTLTPAGTVSLSGRVYDSLGSPLANQRVLLLNQSNITVGNTTTDSSGNYSLQASPNNYTLIIRGSSNSSSLNAPEQYDLYKNAFSLDQSKILDITLPTKKVTVHVQDSEGNPVSDIRIKTDGGAGTGFSIGGDITDAFGFSKYSSGIPTDNNGNVLLWLFPNQGNSSPYTFTAVPPSGSNFLTTILSNISIANDMTVTITLQQKVSLSGHVYDSSGAPLPSQKILLINSSTNLTMGTAITDNAGSYSLQVSPGNYTLIVRGSNNPSSLNVSQQYDLYKNGYTLNENKVLDITLPLKRVTVHVKDFAGNPVSDVRIKTDGGAGTDFSIGGGINDAFGFSKYPDGFLTDSSGNIVLWLFPNQGNTTPYTFTAIPLSANGFLTTTLSNVSIINDTTVNITLNQIVTLSGHVYDSLGSPLANQRVLLLNQSNITVGNTTTDSSGNYSLQASPNNYTLIIRGSSNSSSLNAPEQYDLYKNAFSLDQSKILDITLPTKKVTVHVQDSEGNPVSDIRIKTDGGAGTGFSIGGDITDAFGFSKYSSGIPTDNNGNVLLWLFPNQGNSSPYTFTAVPPSGSAYQLFTLNNITVTGDQTQIISLQYNHAAPTTTATLENQHADGTYSNPITVMLSATAASGYTVASTYYTVDGAAQQAYVSPFTVSGEGNHTITYWSVDNSGVPETPKTSAFTIHVNQAPHVDPLSGADVNAGGTYVEDWSFTDADSSSWTATVDYGDGGDPESLSLNPDKTFSLSHQYDVAGSYTVSVVVRDNEQATGTTMTTVNVNGPPQINALSGGAINKGGTYTENGSFVDADSALWVASVDYGDGSGEHPLDLDGTNFILNHAYTSAGQFTVTVKVADSKGAYDSTTASVIVNAPAVIAQLNGASINKDEIYTEDGSFTDTDSSSWTGSVNYGDGSVEETLSLTGQTFSLNHQYATAGDFSVIVNIIDDQGATATKTASVHVNAAPQLNPLTSAMIPEGETYAVSGSFTDADSTSWTATVNYGDGSGVQPLTLNADKSFSLSHLYKDNGSYDVTVVVVDNEGLSDTGEAMVTVNNLEPVVYDIAASINPVEINTAITASASFTDVGVLDSHTAVWNWGDGTTSVGTVSNGSVSDAHTYTTAGVYEIALTVTDNNGGPTTKLFQYLTVFNPNAGWASGGKEYISPVGAIPGNAAATGKADFGFQVKFFNGDLVPSGKNFSLSFPAGNIEFESSVYQWLVVDGEKATFKADGTFNGLPGYTVLVSVLDQSTPDNGLVRIQIKDADNNVFYDTQSGAVDTADPLTAVTKGKIDVH